MYGRRIYTLTLVIHTVKMLSTGGHFLWQYENSPQGNGFANVTPPGPVGRVRKQFATKGEALAFERHTMEETESKPWLGESVDRRTLKDVVELWFKLHGKSLTAGQHVYDKLLAMVDALGNPLATDLTSKMFAHYRDKRLTGEDYFSEKWKKGASPVTITWSKAIK